MQLCAKQREYEKKIENLHSIKKVWNIIFGKKFFKISDVYVFEFNVATQFSKTNDII